MDSKFDELKLVSSLSENLVKIMTMAPLCCRSCAVCSICWLVEPWELEFVHEIKFTSYHFHQTFKKLAF